MKKRAKAVACQQLVLEALERRAGHRRFGRRGSPLPAEIRLQPLHTSRQTVAGMTDQGSGKESPREVRDSMPGEETVKTPI